MNARIILVRMVEDVLKRLTNSTATASLDLEAMTVTQVNTYINECSRF